MYIYKRLRLVPQVFLISEAQMLSLFETENQTADYSQHMEVQPGEKCSNCFKILQMMENLTEVLSSKYKISRER